MREAKQPAATESPRRGRARPVATSADHRSGSGLAVQTKPVSGIGGRNSLAIQRQAATPGQTGQSAQALIVDNGAVAPAPGTLRKDQFLEQARTAICVAVDPILAEISRDSQDCPYLGVLFRYLTFRDAAFIEQTLREMVPARRPIGSAADLMQIAVARAVQSTRHWVNTGDITGVPGNVPRSLAALANRAAEAPDAVQRKGAGTGSGQNPKAVLEQLGSGRAMESDTAARLGAAFGKDFSGVRIHTDAAGAAMSRDMNARAFTVGNHMAFGAGEYQPGTPEGDALIAHELSHTIQQSEGDTEDLQQKGPSAEDGLEDEADRSALSAVANLWGGADRADPLPAARTGLRLQRCREPRHLENEGAETVRFTREMRDRGIGIRAPGGIGVVGREYTLGIYSPPEARRSHSVASYSFGRWYVQKPGQDKHYYVGHGAEHTFNLDRAGTWSFALRMSLGRNEIGVMYHRLDVQSAEQIAGKKLADVKDSNLTQFFVGLELTSMNLAQMGVRDQRVGDGPYISLSGANPARATGNYPNNPTNRYHLHPASVQDVAQRRWHAIPDRLNDYPQTNYHGHYRRTIEGRDGFDLGSGTSAGWLIGYRDGVVHITCYMYDSAGTLVAQPKYRQAILGRTEHAQYRRFQEYRAEVSTELRKIDQAQSLHLPAVHVASEGAASNEVSLFIGHPPGGSGFRIIDATPGVPVREYSGSTFDAVLDDFNQNNAYPPGSLRLRVPANSLGIAENNWTITTTGASLAQRLSTGWGWASLGLAVLGGVSLIVPGGQPFAPVFFSASAALGAASAGASLYARSREVRPSGMQVAIDIVGLAGSLIGLAGATNMLRHGARVAALTRTGRFVLYTGFATDAFGGVLLGVDGAMQIARILDGRGSPEEKAAAVARILGGLVMNGALLAWGARDLQASRTNIETVLSRSPDLTRSQFHMLSLLEGPTLQGLRGATDDELRAISGLINENPIRANQLIGTYGDDFLVAARQMPGSLEEVAQALHAGAPTAGGTRGAYAPMPDTGPRPVYRERRGGASPNNLSSEVQRRFLPRPNATPLPITHGGQLAARGGTTASGAQTQFDLTLPATATAPEITIPVTIRSTQTRPTSVHGAETGPASMRIRASQDASGQVRYSAEIDVHCDLHRGDIRHAVGHELDEIADIARQGVRGDAITAQKRASIMRAHPEGGTGATPPQATAHDRAAAEEFSRVSAQTSYTGTGHYGLPDDLISRALSLGFGNTAHLELKIGLLRTAGVPADVLIRLRAMAHAGSARAALGGPSPFANPEFIGHLIHTRGTGQSGVSPVYGLHLQSALDQHRNALVASNQPIHLVESADSPRTMGNVEYRSFEQWEWTAPGAPGPRPTAPAGTHPATSGGWTQAAHPKTSFDNLNAFLSDAQQSFNTWSNANAPIPPEGTWGPTAGASGQLLTGGYRTTSSGEIEIITAFAHRTIGSW